MLGHTKKHPTKESNSSSEHSKNKNSDESMDWREAAKEAFGDTSNVALNLRGLRNREGITQAQLGQALGVEQSNISKMERGKRQVGVRIAKRIEEIFNIDYRLFL